MAKYRATIDGAPVVFEAENDAAAGRYIDGQLTKRNSSTPAATTPAAPRTMAPTADRDVQLPPVAPEVSAEMGALLRGDPVARARVEGVEAGRNMSPGAAAGMALQQGTLRNFGDEVGAAGAASGLPVGTPPIISAPIGALRMMYGDKGASQAYDENLARLRGAYEGASRANPVTTTVGEIAGGMAGPMPGGSIPAMAGTAAADAAIAGAGAGETATQRGSGAAVGGLTGGILGAVIGKVGQMIGGKATALMPDQVEAEAARRVTAAQNVDFGKLPATEQRAALQGLDQAYARGQPVMVGDVGAMAGRGDATAALARAEANTSPEAWSTIKNATGERFETQGDRARSWWDAVTGAPRAVDTQAALRAEARATNRPNYRAAYEKGASVWDDGLASLTASPTMRQAIMNASKSSADEAALNGTPMVRNPFKVSESGELTLPQGVTPGLEFWDHVQRNLRRAEEAAPRGGDEARQIGQLRGALNQRLDAAVPEFANARSVARGFFGSEDALEAGQKFLDMPLRAGSDEAQRAIAQLNPAERKLFEMGTIENIRNRLGAVADNQEVGRLFNTPEMRDRLVAAMGPARTEQLQNFLQVEKTMSQLKGALSNSTTAKQLMDMGVLVGVGGGIGGGAGVAAQMFDGQGNLQAPSASTLAGMVGGAMVGHGQRVNRAVANRVAQMLTSTDPEVLQRGAAILQKNAALREGFNRFAGQLSRAAGQQAGAAWGEAQ